MLCPKCGQEYEGSECPRCSGPKIIVNDNDYLRRKKAYEQKQAEKRSASSANKKAPEVDNKVDVLAQITSDSVKGVKAAAQKATDYGKRLSKGKSKKKAGHGKKRDESDRSKELNQSGDGSSKPLYTTIKASESRSSSARKGIRGKLIYYRKPLIILLAVLVVAVVATIGIYNLLLRKNYVLYMSNDNSIYNVGNLESQYVCDIKEAFYESDGNSFYTPKIPDEVNADQIIQSMASENGKYFAAVTYDEEASKYTLYLWNNDGCCKVLENKKQKTIKYLSDKGKIVFIDAEVLNDEGGLGGTELYVYEVSASKTESALNGSLALIDENLVSMTLYVDQGVLVCLDSKYNLYTYDFAKMTGKTVIDYDVANVYTMSSETEHLYTNKVDFVNSNKDADGFFYSKTSGCYYYSIADKSSRYVCKGNGTGNEFIYEKNSYLYMKNVGKLYYATVSSEKVSDFTEVDTLDSKTQYVYLDRDSVLLLINADNQLVSISKGNKKVVEEKVDDNSLTRVTNQDAAFTYWKDGTRYYRASVSAKPVALKDTSGQSSDRSEEDTIKVLDEVIYYKNRLYYYDSNGKMCSCTTKGKEEDSIGDVSRIWLGTELK